MCWPVPTEACSEGCVPPVSQKAPQQPPSLMKYGQWRTRPCVPRHLGHNPSCPLTVSPFSQLSTVHSLRPSSDCPSLCLRVLEMVLDGAVMGH
ncbi:Kinesin-like protein KIN-8B [Dissostichus eleginoides]|uniref:Kinesin-like protein KIN-8B n=1 Tax=Dissostichus eleginoides TaxID=100907 RepID=A0AAD9CID7_DISEL|nr:Kinesin-like protein KIN-8B [Dissostichus eleginoides]